ncbi:MAG TPA: hypothetical protein VD998_03195 [Verrucomicrobiae bacterium]|nr:hypothetical protein [Verrucomicrobiae bacterium]
MKNSYSKYIISAIIILSAVLAAITPNFLALSKAWHQITGTPYVQTAYYTPTSGYYNQPQPYPAPVAPQPVSGQTFADSIYQYNRIPEPTLPTGDPAFSFQPSIDCGASWGPVLFPALSPGWYKWTGSHWRPMAPSDCRALGSGAFIPPVPINPTVNDGFESYIIQAVYRNHPY